MLSTEKRTTYGWVNDTIFIFRWTIPLILWQMTWRHQNKYTSFVPYVAIDVRYVQHYASPSLILLHLHDIREMMALIQTPLTKVDLSKEGWNSLCHICRFYSLKWLPPRWEINGKWRFWWWLTSKQSWIKPALLCHLFREGEKRLRSGSFAACPQQKISGNCLMLHCRGYH